MQLEKVNDGIISRLRNYTKDLRHKRRIRKAKKLREEVDSGARLTTIKENILENAVSDLKGILNPRTSDININDRIRPETIQRLDSLLKDYSHQGIKVPPILDGIANRELLLYIGRRKELCMGLGCDYTNFDKYQDWIINSVVDHYTGDLESKPRVF